MTKCADCDRGHLMACGLCPEYHKEFPADLAARLLKVEARIEELNELVNSERKTERG